MKKPGYNYFSHFVKSLNAEDNGQHSNVVYKRYLSEMIGAMLPSRTMLAVFAAMLATVILSPEITAQDLSSETRIKLPIAEAVRRIVDHSPIMKAVGESRSVAVQKVSEAKAMRGVKINAGLAATTVDSPMQAFGAKLNQARIDPSDMAFNELNDPSHTANWQLRSSLVIPLHLGGIDRYAGRAAEAGVSAADEEINMTEMNVIFSSVKAYFDIILAREALSVASKAVEASAESVENARAALVAQRAVESDLLQAEVHHADNCERLLRADNNLKLALETIANMMGEKDASHYDFELPLLEEHCIVCKDDPEIILEQALNLRPDYRKLLRQSEAALSEARMHESALNPKVSAGFTVEQNRERITSGAEKSNSVVFARIDWDITDGGTVRAKANAARHTAAQLEKIAMGMRDQIHLELRSAVTAINNAIERLKVSKSAIVYGKESLRILRDRYSQGLALMSELLAAETALLSHEMNAVQAFYDYALSRAHLKRAMGELSLETCDMLKQQNF